MTLLDILHTAASGHFPAPDGTIAVCPQPGRTAAVISFSAHFLVCADVDPAWVRSVLPAHDYAAPHGARFLTALADRIGADVGALDAVFAAPASSVSGPDGLREIDGRHHPRVRRALRYRGDVRVWQTADGSGHVLLGRGVAGRWETAFEVEPAARGRGLGRALARAALTLAPAGEPVFAEVSPGNVASMRAVLAAGYRPVCAEVLLPLASDGGPDGG